MDYPLISSYCNFLVISWVLAFVLLTITISLCSTKTVNSKELAPQIPGAWPIIGHLPQLTSGNKKVPFARILGKLADEYGPVFTIRIGMYPYLIVSSFEAAKDCFNTHDKHFANRPSTLASEILGYNYARFSYSNYGSYYCHVRKLVLQLLLSSSRLEKMKHIRVSEIQASIKELYDCGSSSRHIKSMRRIYKDFDDILQGWLDDHIRKKLDEVYVHDEYNQDFIDAMLSATDHDEFKAYGYSQSTVIKATVLSLIEDGSDTSAVHLNWIMSLLLNNPSAMKRAQDEIDSKVGKTRWVEDSDIQELMYLQAIVKEALRLYPPVPLLVPHEAAEDCSVTGYHVPKGTRLYVNVWIIHHDPKVWSQPEKFMPERFLINHIKRDSRGQQFEFIPFGSGRRSCPGMTFASQVTHLILARLLQGFDFSSVSNMPVDMTEGLGITMPKANQVEVLVTPR